MRTKPKSPAHRRISRRSKPAKETRNQTTAGTSVVVPLMTQKAFKAFVSEIGSALAQVGLSFESGAKGSIHDGDFVVGRVTTWKPGKAIALEWHTPDWAGGGTSHMEVRFESVSEGTRITLENRGWGSAIGGPKELIGWFSSALGVPMLRSMAPSGLGDWITDRRARRPSGEQSRSTYRNPIYHYPNFRVILNELALTPEDYLVEVGCGGGAFLKLALQSGCRAAAIDHSHDMIAVAQQLNREAIAQGRLEIHFSDAERLPFQDGTFSCAVMTGVFGFLKDPVAALREMWRVLRPGGRLVLMGSDPNLRGTPAAPEPMASRLRFYSDEEFQGLGRQAGFEDARVVWRELEEFARESGVPEAHLILFRGPGAPFLLATKQ